MPAIQRPCLTCRQLTTNPTRCTTCQTRHDQQRNQARTYYAGDYKARAKIVRDTATTCWICGKGPIDGDPWTADHIYPAEPTSPLLPAHRSCNSRRGNQT